MVPDHKDNQYNLEDLRRYRNGEMSYREQHDLEKSLLEDPFLAEAYEGFIAMSNNNLPYSQSVEELNDNLQNRIKAKKRQVLMLWLYAAAASMIVGFGVIWQIYFVDQPLSISQKTNKTIVQSKPQIAKLKEQKKISNPSSKKVTEQYAVNDYPKQGKKVDEPSFSNAETDKKLVAPIPDFQKEPLAINDVAIKESRKYAAPAQSFSQSRVLQDNARQYITGHVADENGVPLEGAIIHLSGNISTQTNSSGDFKVTSKIGDSLTLAYIGYKTKLVPILNSNIGTVKLETDNLALNEVVIIGYGKAQKRSVSGGVQTLTDNGPTPLKGWEPYQLYLNKMTDTSTIKGTVKVSFLVNSDGSLSDFKTSGTAELFDSAVKLIASGPAWKPFKTNRLEIRKRTEITVSFGSK